MVHCSEADAIETALTYERTSATLKLLVALVVFALSLMVSAPAAAVPPRFAVVIGVSDYGPVHSLPNAVNDARLVKDTLLEIGFENDNVIFLPNPTKAQLIDQLGRLIDKLDRLVINSEKNDGAFVMIYFAGHGFQFEDANYLLLKGAPWVAQKKTQSYYRNYYLDAQEFVETMRKTRVSDVLIVLDACRANPFGSAAGLQELHAPKEGPRWMFAFSAMPGQTATDGEEEHSPYTRTLIEELRRYDVSVSLVFDNLEKSLLLRSDSLKSTQRPYRSGSIRYPLRESTLSENDAPSIVKKIPGTRKTEPAVMTDVAVESDIARRYSQKPIGSSKEGLVELHRIIQRGGMKALSDDAEVGKRLPLYLMGLAAWDGLGGVAKDINKALWYLRRAVAMGSDPAVSALGYYFCCYADGLKNNEEALAWFRVGDWLGVGGATRNLAMMYRDGEGVPKDVPYAISLLESAGKSGNAAAWSDIGWIYNNNKYGLVDRQKARTYFEKGVENGDTDSVEPLATGYEFGLREDGTDKNPERAAQIYFEFADEHGDCKLCWQNLGRLLDSDTYGQADPEAAYSAYLNGSEMGDADSMLAVARALKKGHGVKQSLGDSYHEFERAFLAGNAEAKGSVGSALAKGEGVAPDPEKAATLLREVLALESSSNKEMRHSVYAPNYWGYARDLAKLIAAGSVKPSAVNELDELRSRYGDERKDNMKRFTVPITCNHQKIPFYIYLVDWSRPNDETPADSQADWLSTKRGCVFPADVLTSFSKLKRIARENNVSFVDLSVYALAEAGKSPDK